MKPKPFKRAPTLVAAAVILLVCLIRVGRWDWSEALERLTFDLRAREALRFSPPVASNLGFVFIDEDSLKAVRNGSLGFRFGREWPRQVYGRVIDELADQGAKAVALDILFGELRPDHGFVLLADGNPGPDSDEFFAAEMRRAGNVILAVTPELTLPDLFRTNAAALGDIVTDSDKPEGILRRAKAYRVYRHWHPAFFKLEADPEYGVDLRNAKVEPHQIVLPRKGLEAIKVPLDQDGDFDLADFGGDKLPAGMARKARPFIEERVWHMGIELAARELGLNLKNGYVDSAKQQIVLGGPGGLKRVIPIDDDGYFYIDWCLPENHPQLTQESIQDLLSQSHRRLTGQTNELVNRWRGKLAVVGSSAVMGNNLTDRGATPLQADSLLVSAHWNVANSVIQQRFVRRSPLALDLSLIVALGALSAYLTWRMRVLVGSVLVLILLLLYAVLATVLYIVTRQWVPIFLPVFGAMVMTHVSVVIWRVVFEQAERRRLRSIFSTIVSPKIVTELVQAETLSVAAARREVTVMFADVRGFTDMTDSAQARVADLVRRKNLVGEAAKARFDQQAQETLAHVNLYLGLVADIVIQQDGTLDKFIGDCVMAFWGALPVNPRHAVACVSAAIQAQRAIYELNKARAAENKLREIENRARLAAGLEPEPLLPILFFGTGINTGMATVGLMGSATKTVVRQGNYTVFGREVILASRLETVSGRGRIYIGETTYQHLRRDDPALAATCLVSQTKILKGISGAVTVYEVPWQAPGAPRLEEEFAFVRGTDTTSFTSFVQRG